MLSLHRRLLLGAALVVAVTLLAAGVAVHGMVRRSLVAELDRALLEKAATLAGLVEQEGERIDLEFADVDLAEFSRSHRPQYLDVRDAGGRTVARSPSLADGDLPPLRADAAAPEVRPLLLPNGSPGRIAYVRAAARVDPEFPAHPTAQVITVALARDTLDVRSTLADLDRALAVVGLLALGASVATLSWMLRFGLRPAALLAREIAAIDERNLSARLAAQRLPPELRPIAQRLNELLERLEQALRREIAMTANVAHELRTPLAGLRATLELALARQRGPEEYRAAAAECLAIAVRTQGIVENLLTLARLEGGHDGVRRTAIDVGSLMESAWAPLRARAARRGLRVEWQVSRALLRETDGDLLSLVLRNVLENAVDYADDEGTVRIVAAERDGAAQVEVCNTGSALTRDQVGLVFERFWRGDPARGGDGAHCGLGLTLARMIVERLGGTIAADASDAGEFRITLML